MSFRKLKCFFLEYAHGRSPEGAEKARHDQAQEVYFELVKPACMVHYVRRSSELAHPAMITTDHLRQVEEADLVIADLTHGDPTVYFCLAHRFARGRAHIKTTLLISDASNGNQHSRFLAPLGQTLMNYDISENTDTENYDEPARYNDRRERIIAARQDISSLLESMAGFQEMLSDEKERLQRGAQEVGGKPTVSDPSDMDERKPSYTPEEVEALRDRFMHSQLTFYSRQQQPAPQNRSSRREFTLYEDLLGERPKR
ncbi:MAG: hypothetical protein ACPGOV_02405 [Magnetovibrionaceae bacterium]